MQVGYWRREGGESNRKMPKSETSSTVHQIPWSSEFFVCFCSLYLLYFSNRSVANVLNDYCFFFTDGEEGL